jgi:hypothetical protein
MTITVVECIKVFFAVALSKTRRRVLLVELLALRGQQRPFGSKPLLAINRDRLAGASIAVGYPETEIKNMRIHRR